MSRNPKADTWMPLYIADYGRDTMHLTRDQHGGYLLLLMACWIGGGRLPNRPEALAAICKATPREWGKLAPVLIPFFKTRGEWLVHKRVLEERERSARLIESKRENGRKGGRPPNRAETDRFSVALANHNRDETPARVKVKVEVIPTSVDQPTSELSSQIEDSESKVGKSAAILPLARQAAR